jgi:hypothetical protein
MPGTCHECKRPLIVIDNRGEHLVGCLSCNLWCDRDGNAVKLSVEDLAALHAAEVRGAGRSRRPPLDYVDAM